VSVTLILGGARSGKSARAQRLAEDSGLAVCYIATAPALPGDDEWTRRIAHHRANRPAHWRLVEEQHALAPRIAEAEAGECLLVDCLTLWLANLMRAGSDVEAETAALCEALAGARAEVVLVSNEVGMGLVPDTALGRAFRDAQGRLNQAVAAVADRVEFVAAGLPLVLKGENT